MARKRALLAGHRPDPSLLKPSGVTLDFLPKDLTSTEFDKADETTGKVTDLDQVDLLGTPATSSSSATTSRRIRSAC